MSRLFDNQRWGTWLSGQCRIFALAYLQLDIRLNVLLRYSLF